jgi:hypothetical protein
MNACGLQNRDSGGDATANRLGPALKVGRKNAFVLRWRGLCDLIRQTGEVLEIDQRVGPLRMHYSRYCSE